MASPFEKLNVDRELAIQFMAEFSRFEYALKSSGFIKVDRGGGANPDWDGFAKKIVGGFAGITDPLLPTAVTYFLGFPPKKQVCIGGQLSFSDTPPQQTSVEEQVLLMVRRVRNNLFHGGKFHPQTDPDRDRLLLEHSRTILRLCLCLDTSLQYSFEN
jgi:hypothetical protein